MVKCVYLYIVLAWLKGEKKRLSTNWLKLRGPQLFLFLADQNGLVGHKVLKFDCIYNSDIDGLKLYDQKLLLWLYLLKAGH